MAKVETVRIVDDNRRGFKTINKSDYDSKIHKRFTKKMERELQQQPQQAEQVQQPQNANGGESVVKSFFGK